MWDSNGELILHKFWLIITDTLKKVSHECTNSFNADLALTPIFTIILILLIWLSALINCDL